MESFKEFFDSKTIKPSYKYVHLVLSLFLFEEQYPDGFGRYRLGEEMLVSQGMAKTIFKKLKDNQMIKVISPRKGHSLSEKGSEILSKIKGKIVSIKNGGKTFLKIALGSHFYISLVRDANEKLTNGIVQRDAAVKIKDVLEKIQVKIEGKPIDIIVKDIGATCLIYINKEIQFPDLKGDSKQSGESHITKEVIDFLIKEFSLRNNDVIVIGGASTEIKGTINKSITNIVEERVARLAALNSALSFFNYD